MLADLGLDTLASDRVQRSRAMAGRPIDDVLGRIGPLEVRLARDEDEIAAAQEIRYRVFREERAAAGRQNAMQRDEDRFDPVCHHVLVTDTSLPVARHRQIVGTYRLLDREGAKAAGSYYSQDEFDIESLIARHPQRRLLELGRSCVIPEYRSKRTIEALWQGIWAYVRHRGIDLMAGCASFAGTVPAAHAEALSLLAHSFSEEGAFAVSALPHLHRPMDLMPAEAVDPKRAIKLMPPLVKGYLRLGARFGDGCVVDEEFGTVDVFVVMPVERIGQRYIAYYSN
jgi:putative hemolysin